MAKIENSKIRVSLDNDSKRILRNLTRAIDRLSRSRWDETNGRAGVKRLEEPAEDLEPGERQLRTGQRNICGND